MQRRPSRVLPIPHLFMGMSIALLVALFLTAGTSSPVTAEVVDGRSTGTVTMEGERVVDAQQDVGRSPTDVDGELDSSGTAAGDGT